MFSASYATPSKDVNHYNGDDGQSCDESTSPRSFVPLLMSHVDSGHDISDDVSLYSDQASDDNFMERFAREAYTVAMDTLGGQAADRVLDVEAFSDDDCSSVHSTKTSKSAVTASTQSLSQNLTQSFLPLPNDNPHQDGTNADLAQPSTRQQHPPSSSDLDYFEALAPEPVLVLGMDIGHLSRRMQFVICATGVVGFNLMYGYLQELISVEIMNRQLGLFLAVMQFIGYTTFSYILNTYVYSKKQIRNATTNSRPFGVTVSAAIAVPFMTYLGLSMLRALDLGMTNLAMQYINYPAKTLMKSSRVVFTMIFGVLITRKKYLFMDYFVVLCMVAGLAVFMHADATSSAVFQPAGVVMLTVSLICDGAISNMSESIMRNYGVGQDEFIFRMYSIALVAITAAAAIKGDLQLGLLWMMQPGTYDELQQEISAEEVTWSVSGKIGVIVLFSIMGFLGSSCSAAITKHFGALTMSITSTARKAATLFLSFFLFNNVCTLEHIVGVVIFITALTAKSFRRTQPKAKMRHSGTLSLVHDDSHDLELQFQAQVVRTDKTSPVPLRTVGSYSATSPVLSRTPPVYKYGTPGRRQNVGKHV